MKCILLVTICALAVAATTASVVDVAETCSAENCKLEEQCVCASGKSPIETAKTPQFVVMSFDDAVTMDLYKTYYSQILTADRKNPDGSNIKASFFVPHEYTDYEAVNSLYVQGHDIGVHSISKNALAGYWAEADKATLIDEFLGQKQIISQFANIPKADIDGVRTPLLQLANDTSFTAYTESEFTFDSSWPARSSNRMFPYSLKYQTEAPCPVGSCPKESYNNMWVSPLNSLVGAASIECNILYACGVNGTKAQIKAWLKEQFDATFNSERTPFDLIINSAWFYNMVESYAALQEFIDELLENKQVFFVTESQLLEWVKSPVELEAYKTPVVERTAKCTPVVCPLVKNENEFRYMKSCVKCPSVYPWLGNHDGAKPKE